MFGKLLQHHHLNYAGMFCDELASHFFINLADLILMALLKKKCKLLSYLVLQKTNVTVLICSLGQQQIFIANNNLLIKF